MFYELGRLIGLPLLYNFLLCCGAIILTIYEKCSCSGFSRGGGGGGDKDDKPVDIERGRLGGNGGPPTAAVNTSDDEEEFGGPRQQQQQQQEDSGSGSGDGGAAAVDATGVPVELTGAGGGRGLSPDRRGGGPRLRGIRRARKQRLISSFMGRWAELATLAHHQLIIIIIVRLRGYVDCKIFFLFQRNECPKHKGEEPSTSVCSLH
jgi:hypothetical protein